VKQSLDIRWAILLLILAGCAQPDDQSLPNDTEPYTLAMHVSTNALTIGDPVTIRVSAAHPPDVDVQWPSLESAWVVRDSRVSSRSVGDDISITDMQYNLTTFETGSFLLSTGEVVFTQNESGQITRPFPEQMMTVRSVLGENDEPRPIRPVMDWPGRLPRWIFVVVGIVLGALLIGLLVRYLWNKPRTFIKQPPPPPPHVTALNALRLLLERRLIEDKKVELFFVELSQIVRTYIEQRFGLRAPERTTEEFIREATQSRLLTSVHQELVSHFLEQCDLVKFAQYRPDEDSMRSAYDAAVRLVEETKPVQEERDLR
jgi:hypothetical protein